MATKPRHLKTPLQLWIADNRKEKGLTPGDLARLTSVTEDTARGRESRGSPSADAITILERAFGKPAPRDAGAGVPGGDVAAAIDRQTAVLAELLEAANRRADAAERRADAIEQWARSVTTAPSRPQPDLAAKSRRGQQVGERIRAGSRRRQSSHAPSTE